MEDANQFGGRLREMREAAGLTQVQLAQKAGLHPQGLIKLERGERKPAWETVIALATALDVSCDAFRQTPASILPPRRGRPPKPADPVAAPARGKPAEEATGKGKKRKKR